MILDCSYNTSPSSLKVSRSSNDDRVSIPLFGRVVKMLYILTRGKGILDRLRMIGKKD
jgi:hypothetical protein